jgi:hypothetical protein
MSLYAFLVARLPKPVVDWTFVVVQAVLLFLVVLYSDKPVAAFPYLKL